MRVFEDHLAICTYCLEHSDSEFHQEYERFKVRQTEEQAAFARVGELTAAPWEAMGSDEGRNEMLKLLTVLRRENRREHIGDLRLAIDELRRAAGIPEDPADIAEYQKKWAFPYDKNHEADYEANNWAGAGSKDVYLQKQRAAETLESMIWTLYKLDGPLTTWEHDLLYHYRILGDPKEHLRKLGWITWPAPAPGEPDCPPPDFKFE